MAKKRSEQEKLFSGNAAVNINAEISHDKVEDYAWDQSATVKPPKKDSQLISIRLAADMIREVRGLAKAKGDIGYQQVIKLYIAEGIRRDKAAATGQHTASNSITMSCSLQSSSTSKEYISKSINGIDSVALQTPYHSKAA